MGIFESYTWLWAYPLLAIGILLVEILLSFGYLMLLCKRVDFESEQEEDAPHYRWVVEQLVESVVPLVRIGVKVSGMEKVPPQGRFMLVCNHCSNSDPVMLLSAFKGRQVAFIAKKEVKDMFVVGPMLHKVLGQFIDRENDREALKTILKCVKILKEDKASIGVFPEGYILPHRKLHHLRPGVFKIAQKAQAPIVVCTLKGTRELIPSLAHLRHTDVELKVVTVLSVEELTGRATTDIAQQVYEIMAADLGPENVAEED
jgi:1-acyl-sn-glycerol-3-phosphate acyltransferase